MIKVADLFEVTPTITRLTVTARAQGTRWLHRWIVGEGVAYETLPIGTKRDIEKGRATDIGTKINAHGDPVRGQPEIGWGYKTGTIPCEILDAKVTALAMHCWDGIKYDVSVDIELDQLTVETLKATWIPG